MQRNVGGGGLLPSGEGGAAAAAAGKNQTMVSSPTKTGEGIKNKRVFIDNTTDSILQSKSNKTASFMNTKPVGAVSGTGTTDVHPKVHSVSPRGNVGSSIVGLGNIVVGPQAQQSAASSGSANITKVNVKSGSVASPTKDQPQAAES